MKPVGRDVVAGVCADFNLTRATPVVPSPAPADTPPARPAPDARREASAPADSPPLFNGYSASRRFSFFKGAR
jgi:hypothetical protein